MIQDDIEKIFYSEKEIHKIVASLGKRISEDYKGKNLLLVSILKGSAVFAADLMREITIPCRIDFMCVSSYGNGTSNESREVKIIKDLDKDLKGLDILLVEDILDSGKTLNFILKTLEAKNPASVKICTFLDKPERRAVNLKADYCGATVPDAFVVGYGLDFAEKYRNLPYIGVLKEEIYKNS